MAIIWFLFACAQNAVAGPVNCEDVPIGLEKFASFEKLTLCPASVEYEIDWVTKSEPRKKSGLLLNVEIKAVRISNQSDEYIWKEGPGPYGDPCATTFIHIVNGQKALEPPPEWREWALKYWSVSARGMSDDAREIERFFQSAATSCDYANQKYGHWCSYIEILSLEQKKDDTSYPRCRGAEANRYEPGYEAVLQPKVGDWVPPFCYPARLEGGDLGSYDARKNRKPTMTALEWTLTHKVGFDPTRQTVLLNDTTEDRGGTWHLTVCSR